MNDVKLRVQELCESRGGRPWLSFLMSLMVSVDVKQIEPCLGIGHSLSLICQPTSEDIKLYIIVVKLSSSLIVLMVSMDVKQR